MPPVPGGDSSSDSEGSQGGLVAGGGAAAWFGGRRLAIIVAAGVVGLVGVIVLIASVASRGSRSTEVSKGDACPGYGDMDACPSEFPTPYLPGEYPETYDYTGAFPKDFIFGMGTAAYQIEGAYREDGRGASIWDTFSGANTVGMPGANCTYCCKMAPCPINPKVPPEARGATGNVAINHYHMYKTDIAMMKSMGLKYYRFSISWPRIIPTGKKADGVNKKGIEFYSNLIDELLKAGITPFVTLYHWDLPQGLLDPEAEIPEQGWWSRDEDGKPDGKIIPHWLDYVRVCYKEFGDRVKTWVTFNEPWTFIFLGTAGWGKAPSIEAYSNIPVDPYIAAHNMLNAHAQAVKVYRDEFQPTQKGQIGITNCADWREPMTNTPADIGASERSMIMRLGWFAEPIFGTDGGYPPEMRHMMGDSLPNFTAEERSLLKGSADFFGLNHYGTGFVEFNPNQTIDFTYAKISEGGLEQGQSAWLFGSGWGFRKLLNWIKRRYNNPKIMVTEGGWSLEANTTEQAVADESRTMYFANYTAEMRKAINTDGVNVIGYFAWSLLDNYEWEQGYGERFGLGYNFYNFGVDPDGPVPNINQPQPDGQWRQRKDSSCWFEALYKGNSLINPKDPKYKCTCPAVFAGDFKNKFDCERTITITGTTATITGKEPFPSGPHMGDKCVGKGKDMSWMGSANGFVSGGSIVINFYSSHNMGPARVEGFWDEAAGAILWGDGSNWTATTHGSCGAAGSVIV